MGVDLFEKYNVPAQKPQSQGTDLFEKYNVSPQEKQKSSGMLPNSFSETDLAKMPGYAMDAARAVDLGAQRFGGNLMQDIGQAFTKSQQQLPYDSIPQGARFNGSQRLEQAGAKAANLTPQDVGIKNPDAGTNFVANTSQFAPYALTAGRMPSSAASPTTMPVMRNLIGPAAQKLGLSGLLYGTTQSPPGEAVKGGLEDGLLSMLTAEVPGIKDDASAIYQGAKNLWGNITGKPLQDSADSFYNTLSKGMAPDELNKTNTQNIIGNYKSQAQEIGKGYQDLGSLAEQRGYLPTGTKPIAGIMEQTNQKFIDSGKDTLSGLDNLVNKDDPESPLKNISSGLKGAIEKYQSSPTYSNAHTLQSMLGSEAADFSSGVNTDIADKQTARILNSVRGQLKNDITSSFESNGDKDLAETYNNLSDQWKSNVVPYQNVSGIWRAIKGKNHPANIINVLDDNDELGSNQTIRDHLKANPENTNTVLAQALNSAAKRNSSGSYNVGVPKILDKYNNLPDNIRQLNTPNLEQQLSDLQAAQDTRNKWAKPTETAVSGLLKGLGIGAGAGSSYEIYRLLKDL